MKKYLFLWALLFPMGAMAASSNTIRFCGHPQPYYENGNEIFVLFVRVSTGDYFNGSYAYAPNLETQFEQMTSMGNHHICVDYQLPIESNINSVIKFSAGTADQSSLKCQYGSQYTGWSCVRCPTGYIAKIPADAPGTTGYLNSLHTNTTCAYCDRGYYHNGSSCVKCPDSGYTGNFDSPSIANCYKYSETSDETGTYASQKCYYQ